MTHDPMQGDLYVRRAGSGDFSWVGALGAVNLFAFAWSVSGATELLARELGVLEIAQLVLLAIAALLFGLSFHGSRGPGRSAALMLLGVAVCSFYRELDLAALGAPDRMSLITKSSVRDVVIGLVGLGLVVYAVRQRADWGDWYRLATRPAAWPLLGAGVLVAGGVLIDVAFDGGLQEQFFEELVEFNGYVLFVLAAARHGRLVSRDEVVTRPVMPT